MEEHLSIEEVEVPGVTAPAEPQTPEQPEAPAPEPPETVPFQYHGEERSITASHLDSLAAELGTSRDAALMWLQQGKDYGRLVQENRQRERDLADREAQVNAYLQQIEAHRTQANQNQYTQPAQPTGLPQGDDPIAMIRWQNEQMLRMQERQDSFYRELAEERQRQREAEQQRWYSQQEQAAEEAYKQVATEWKTQYPKLPLPSFEDLAQEVVASGMAANPRMSYADGLRRAARNLLWDQAQQISARQAVEQMRSPKATVTLPGSGSAPRQAPAKPKSEVEQVIDNMTMAEVGNLIPDKR